MNLHENAAHDLISNFGALGPNRKLIKRVEEVEAAMDALGGSTFMVKAQVHAGGRGKAGGVRYVTSREKCIEVVNELLGTRLVTYQTDAKGQPINQILITVPCDIEQELYLSAVIDRSLQRVVIIASTEGGVEIEEVARETPEKIIRFVVDPMVGILPHHAYDLLEALALPFANFSKTFSRTLIGLYRAFIETDLSTLEINPLIIDKQNQLICLDAKVIVDDNALFRQPEMKALRDPAQEDSRENHAHEWGLNYIALDGNIGCMVNGAGLAMATMDLIKFHGGSPANFLDVGGTATKARVVEAFKIILSDEKVKSVLINIFGGIVRCDMIAEGIISAVSEVGIQIPIMVRLVGNNAERGIALLRDSGLNLMASDDLETAATQIIERTH